MNKKRIVFITGASRGIGASIAQILGVCGYDIAIGYKQNRHLAGELSKQLKKDFGINALPTKISMESPSSIKAAINKIEKKLGCVDILINNAGISDKANLEEITPGRWDRMMSINLRGPFITTQRCLPIMIKQKWGKIVNIGSVGGQVGGKNQIHYAAAKAGLINLTKSISNLYSKFGINCNTVSIGLVATDMSKCEINSKNGKTKISQIPIGRVGFRAEVAEVVKFLVSDSASYICGQTINVNGGAYSS